METNVRAKKFGGSIGIIIPKEIVEKQRISVNDRIEIRIEKKADLNFMWGKGKDIKKSTQEIMQETDEGETDE